MCGALNWAKAALLSVNQDGGEYDTSLPEINYEAKKPFTFMFLQVDKCAGLIIGPVRSTLGSARTLSYVLSRYTPAKHSPLRFLQTFYQWEFCVCSLARASLPPSLA